MRRLRFSSAIAIPLFARRSETSSLRQASLDVEVVATVRHALAKIRYRHYRHILIGVSTPGSDARRLAAIARRRQPEAKLLVLVSVQDQACIRDASFDYVLKEDIFSDLLSLM